MKARIVISVICAAISQIAFAEAWESPTKDCSLVFPDGRWTFQEGGVITGGQILLSALNHEQSKSINIMRFDVGASFSIHNPRFAQGVKEGFAKTGARLISDGYTNINNRLVYWFTGEKSVNNQIVATLRYASYEDGRLYQLVAEHLKCNISDDDELQSIIKSFVIRRGNLPPVRTASAESNIVYQIGRLTGFLLVIILAIGIINKQNLKRTQLSKNLSQKK